MSGNTKQALLFFDIGSQILVYRGFIQFAF